jgi:thiamine phosphate synthase YjbQ (UPF0047 family)
METIQVKTDRRWQFVDVTEAVRKISTRSGISTGISCLYVPHYHGSGDHQRTLRS